MSEDPVPNSDPDHIDPAGHIADLLESGEVDVELTEDQDPKDLREFIESVEESDDTSCESSQDVQPDPGTTATVRIARAMLETDAVADE